MFNINPEEAKGKFASLFFQGKKLVPDIFGRALFTYVAEVKSNQEIKLSGIFQVNKREYAIEDIDFLFEGPPPGFIKGIFLYFIGTDIRYKALKSLPRIIDRETLLELKADEDVEIIIFGEELLTKIKPRLILRDRFGVTAELPDSTNESELKLTSYIKKAGGWICQSDKVHESLSLLHAGGWQIENSAGQEVVPFENLELDWEEEGEFIRVKGRAFFHGETIDVQSIRKERQVPLPNGKMGLLPDNFKLYPFENLLFKRHELGKLQELVGEKLLQIERGPYKPMVPISPSSQFNGILRPYQSEGLKWLNFLYQNHFSALLADDMGLGKTIQTLAFLSLLPEDSSILIVMPTTLRFNWLAEIRKFLPERESAITLVSYSQLRLNLEYYQQQNWEVLILDEAQVIKNASTQIFKAVTALNSRFRLSITGTPIENKLAELVNHFKFLLPDLQLTEEAYTLRKITGPFMLRRKKENVLKELPDKIEETVLVELPQQQIDIYHQYLKEAQSNTLNRIQILEVILRLRQIACHPVLAGFAGAPSAKMDQVFSDIDTLVAEGRKVIVFSQFTTLLKGMGKILEEAGISYLYLDGETSDRETPVNRFQNDPEAKLFLISLKAGGVGLNLTAADTVLLFDPWWNLAVEEQAISRAHRMGQKNSVLVKRYVAMGTIEEKIEMLKATKKNLADQMISEENWSNEQLQQLLHSI